MKLFTARFFGGICMVAVGSLAVLSGVLPLLSPEKTLQYSLIGVALILGGIVLVRVGLVVAEDRPKTASRVAINTLKHAKFAYKKRKK